MSEDQNYKVVGGRGTMTVFEIYIKATPERVWEAITDPEMRKPLQLRRRRSSPTGPRARATRPRPPAVWSTSPRGENVEVDPPRRLVQTFTALWSEDVKSEGQTRG